MYSKLEFKPNTDNLLWETRLRRIQSCERGKCHLSKKKRVLGKGLTEGVCFLKLPYSIKHQEDLRARHTAGERKT